MTFRVTPRLASDFATRQLSQQTYNLQRLQEQLSTGVRVHRPSDDPVTIRRSLIQQDQLGRLESHVSSIKQTQSRLSQAHVQLRDAHNLFVQARQVGLAAGQSIDESERSVLAAELEGILTQLESIANSADATGYLFSGTATHNRPFDIADDGTATYNGTDETTELQLTNSVGSDVLAPGSRIFQSRLRDPTIIVGSTGVAAGTGTDSAYGIQTIELQHTTTTFAGASGVLTGTSSAALDTVLGPSGTHQLVINDTSGSGTSGTISLNGGVAVNFTNLDSDLKVTGPNGEVVYLDTTSIAPGFSGSVDIAGSGTISFDEGQTATPITFSANQSITDSQTGRVVHLDTTNASRVGSDSVEFPGTADAFQAIAALRDDLLNTRELSATQNREAIGRRLNDIERIEGHLLNEIGVQSVALQRIDRLLLRTEDQQLDQRTVHSDTVSADLANAAVDLQELLNLQQFTMATISQLLSPNLLQFLQ